MRIDIVIPTTDLDVADETAKVAMSNAGMDAGIHIMLDLARAGAVKTTNEGLKRTSGDVLLMNDDVRPVTEDWLAKLFGVLAARPDAGYVGPSGHCRTAPMCYATGPTDDPVQEVDCHPFFCTLIRRDVFEDVGLFDPMFIHYGFDQDHQWAAHRMGWKSYWHPGIWVEHEIGGWTQRHPEMEETRQTWKELDQYALDEKWSS